MVDGICRLVCRLFELPPEHRRVCAVLSHDTRAKLHTAVTSSLVPLESDIVMMRCGINPAPEEAVSGPNTLEQVGAYYRRSPAWVSHTEHAALEALRHTEAATSAERELRAAALLGEAEHYTATERAAWSAQLSRITEQARSGTVSEDMLRSIPRAAFPVSDYTRVILADMQVATLADLLKLTKSRIGVALPPKRKREVFSFLDQYGLSLAPPRRGGSQKRS